MSRLAIVGAGSWGTALAMVLAPRFETVGLWMHEADLAAGIAATRENSLFLPGFRLPENVTAVTGFEELLDGACTVLGVMPSRHARTVYTRMLPYLTPRMQFVTATKGLEAGTLLRMSEVVADVIGQSKFQPPVAVLSGPTFAREVAGGEPTAVVIASGDAGLAASIQRQFAGPTFRLYTNSDTVGVEIGAALKNVIAVAAGICHGLGLGSNAAAALITRGLAEITRLACAMGGQPRTLAGLAGLGDLVLTCSGGLSRNRSVGVELARGRTIGEITGSMRMVAEGVDTTATAVELGRRHGVELPIANQMDRILRGAIAPREAIRELMERGLRNE